MPTARTPLHQEQGGVEREIGEVGLEVGSGPAFGVVGAAEQDVPGPQGRVPSARVTGRAPAKDRPPAPHRPCDRFGDAQAHRERERR
jgi:hypothetical protein